jgi:hypothetical protein
VAALGVPQIPDLPVCSGRPTPPSSQLLPLVCLGRANQRAMLLVGVHSVSKMPITDLVSHQLISQVRILLVRSHLYLGRLPNNNPLLAAALVYLDLSNSNSNSRIPKANKVLPGLSETNRDSHRAQLNLNRVDVSCLVIYGLLFWQHHPLIRNSIWHYSDSTACYGTIRWHGRWSIWKYAATGCSAARRPTAHIRSVRKQDSNTYIRGRRTLW